MTRDQARLLEALQITVSAADRLRDSLRFDGVELRTAIALSPQGEAGALREVDAFVQRYQQMVEHMLHRLYGAIYRVEELGERPPPLTRLLGVLEGLNVLNTAASWKVHLEIRNRLVHEYPLDPADRIQALNDAKDASHAILADLDRAVDYIKRCRLLEFSYDQ